MYIQVKFILVILCVVDKNYPLCISCVSVSCNTLDVGVPS